MKNEELFQVCYVRWAFSTPQICQAIEPAWESPHSGSNRDESRRSSLQVSELELAVINHSGGLLFLFQVCRIGGGLRNCLVQLVIVMNHYCHHKSHYNGSKDARAVGS